MTKTKITTWTLLAFTTLVIAVVVGNFVLDSRSIYKGGSDIVKNSDVLQTSALTANTVRRVATLSQFTDEITEENYERLNKNTVSNQLPAVEVTKQVQYVPTPYTGPVKICNPGEIPVIAGGQLQGCAANESTHQESGFDCESQGKTTYFGEDQPGLLYGMCI